VLRHGDAPVVRGAPGTAALASAVTHLARAWRAEGMASFAVIGRDGARLRALLGALPEDLGRKLLRAEAAEALSA
jgi:hypothetical protein